MIPLNEFKLVEMRDVPAGTMLFPTNPRLAGGMVMVSQETAQVEALVFMPTERGLRINFGKLAEEHERFFSYSSARIVVDEKSLVHGTTSSPGVGSVMLNRAGAGILIPGERLFMLDGTILPVNWGQDPGYSSWHVEIPQPHDGSTILLSMAVPQGR